MRKLDSDKISIIICVILVLGAIIFSIIYNKKEKNSNKENKEDIQSNDQQREKEVFKSRNELNLKESKLKEDLIKVLDISIDDIEID